MSGTVTVSANAADNVGVAQVQFYYGATLIGADTSSPYSVQWNTAGLTGTQQLTAKATDGAGNATTQRGRARECGCPLRRRRSRHCRRTSSRRVVRAATPVAVPACRAA
ncbi:MAG: Ig-like domain-containing protein [Pseudomonadota bacterium]